MCFCLGFCHGEEIRSLPHREEGRSSAKDNMELSFQTHMSFSTRHSKPALNLRLLLLPKGKLVNFVFLARLLLTLLVSYAISFDLSIHENVSWKRWPHHSETTFSPSGDMPCSGFLLSCPGHTLLQTHSCLPA